MIVKKTNYYNLRIIKYLSISLLLVFGVLLRDLPNTPNNKDMTRNRNGMTCDFPSLTLFPLLGTLVVILTIFDGKPSPPPPHPPGKLVCHHRSDRSVGDPDTDREASTSMSSASALMPGRTGPLSAPTVGGRGGGGGVFGVLGVVGALKEISILPPFETCCLFNTKIKGNHHLQGNVYNVRISVGDMSNGKSAIGVLLIG